MHNNPPANISTVRSLADEIVNEIRKAVENTKNLCVAIVGPESGANEGNAKDPRSDLRSSLERSLDRLRGLNQELSRINNAVGVSSIKETSERNYGCELQTRSADAQGLAQERAG